MIFQAGNWLHGFWLIPVFIALVIYTLRAQRKSVQAFAQNATQQRKRGRQFIRIGLRFTVLIAMIIALAQPAWNPTPTKLKRRGRDVVFIIDVSRSMLAEDLAPNRLERAKISIRDVLNKFQNHRVGLVAFAGSTVVKCPLTFDHNFTRLALDNLTTNSITRGGSLIGDAIRKALNEVFVETDSPRGRDIILISDGEDQESFPLEAARQANERGVRIISIGLGDDKKGHPIPFEDRNGRRQYIEYQGKRVLTKLVPTTLKEVAQATENGRYLHVATGHIDLDDIYARLVANQELQELDSREVVEYQSKFQLFLLLALIAAVVEGLINER